MVEKNIWHTDENYGWIKLKDGTEIDFIHRQDCCESVYADLDYLKDTGFEDANITRRNLKIELVKNYGIRINGYGIPCYNNQNGYYNPNIRILINNEEIFDIDLEEDLNIANYY